MALQEGQDATGQYIHYVYDQIQNAGTNFISEANTYLMGMKVFGDGKGTIQIPSGGDALVDQSLATVLGLVYDTHQLVGDAMNRHGWKMNTVNGTMQGAEAKNIDAIYKLLGGVPAGNPVDPYPTPRDGTSPDYLANVSAQVRQPAYRAMPKRFATPQIESPPSLAPYERDLVGGDPKGLTQFAQAVTGYVRGQGDHTVQFLKNTVESLVKDDNGPAGYHSSDGGWAGSAAYAFRSAFIVDASIMNGLHCTMCKTAGIINEFAAALASAENGLERALYAVRGLVQRYVSAAPVSTAATPVGSDYLGYFSAGRSGGKQQLLVNIPVGMALMTLLGSVAKPYFEKAEQARHTAASRLAAMAEILLSGVHYYEGHASNVASGAGVLVTGDEYGAAIGAHSTDPDLNTLSSNLFADESQLKMGSSDTGAIAADLTSLGLNATNAGSIVGDVQSFKAAQGALPKVGGIASFLGAVLPIIAEIGLGAA